MYLAYDDIKSKYLATYAKTIDTNPLIKNLHPIMIKPAPSSLRLRVLPIQIHVIPNAIIIIPAVRRGLNSILELVEDFILEIQVWNSIKQQLHKYHYSCRNG